MWLGTIGPNSSETAPRVNLRRKRFTPFIFQPYQSGRPNDFSIIENDVASGCLYGGNEYSEGSEICQAGRAKRCSWHSSWGYYWADAGRNCLVSPN